MPELTLDIAVQKAREVHFGAGDSSDELPHAADGAVEQELMSALVDSNKASRRGRAQISDGKDLWDPDAEDSIADFVDELSEDGGGFQMDAANENLQARGLKEFSDQYTAERVRNRKSEVLTRYVTGLIEFGTPILNNFFETVRMDAGQTMGQLQEFVDVVESFNQMGYYPIDPDRGEIRSFTPGFSQSSERINPMSAMYGVKVEYENRLKRVLNNFDVAEILAMMSVGWSQASAEARERDASRFLTNYLAPTTVMSNSDPQGAPLGAASGVASNGKPNGTLDVDRDVPRIMDYMQHEQGMNLSNIKMLIPHNAWPFFNMRKGYRRFLGRDGEPLYESPSFNEGPQGALANESIGGVDERYGISARGAGFNSPAAAANYLQQSRESEAGQAAAQMTPGPMPFLPKRIPNWMNEFNLPNSAFGPAKAVLTPFEQAEQRYYAEGHELRNDDVTGQPRPIMTTDVMLFDGTRPLYMVEHVPPTSWDATNEEYGTSMVVMVEGYAMANRSRGEQAVKLEGMILDDNYTHEIRLNAKDIDITDHPLKGGTSRQ